MFINRTFVIVTSILFLSGCFLLAWTQWPFPPQTDTLSIAASDFSPLTSESSGRQILFTYPSRIRLGDASQVSLILKPLAAPGETQPLGDIHAEAESRLDLPNVLVAPAEMSSTALLPGRITHFDWVIQPVQEGSHSGRAWLYLRILSIDGSMDEQRALAAPPMNIQVVSLAGIPAPILRVIGIASLLISIFLGGSFLVKTGNPKSRQNLTGGSAVRKKK